MTISLTEVKIRDHERNASMYDAFAVRAEDEGKFHMASAYRVIATTHRHCVDDLKAHLDSLKNQGAA